MSGRDDLSCWFGLSYASWLTIPRVLMEQMPDEWQRQMAALLVEYEGALKNQPDNRGTRVQMTDGKGNLIKTPEWVINYRRPDMAALREIFGGITPREEENKKHHDP